MRRFKETALIVILLSSTTLHFLSRNPIKSILSLFILLTIYTYYSENIGTLKNFINTIMSQQNSNIVELSSVIVAMVGVWITFYTASTNWKKEAINKVIIEINTHQSLICSEMVNIINKNDFLATRINTFAENILKYTDINNLNIESELLAHEIEDLSQRLEYASTIFMKANAFRDQYNLILIRKKVFHLMDGIINAFHEQRMETIPLQIYLKPNEPQFYADFANRANALNIPTYLKNTKASREHISQISGMMRGILLDQLIPPSWKELLAIYKSPSTLLITYKLFKGEKVELKKRYAQFINDYL